MSIELKDDLPAMSPQLAKDVMQKYQEICRAMLDESDYATIQGKKYKKRSAYRKLARAFNISDSITKTEKEEIKEGVIYRIWVEAAAPNGRTCLGVGSCSSRERNFAHPDHDIYAIAHTRAKNRAISDLLGAGDVSAEELTADKPEEPFYEFKDGKKKNA